jgi:hypothetical protein
VSTSPSEAALPVRRRGLSLLAEPRPGMVVSVCALLAVWLVCTRHGPFSADQVGDLSVYDAYHFLMSEHGLLPYRDFDFEYPPGALIPIRLVGGDLIRMSLFMLAGTAVAQVAAWRISGWRAGWLMVLLPPVAGALVRTHFDLLASAFAMVGLWLIVAPPRGRGWVEAGFAVLALGTMTKLWPAALAAVAFAWLYGRGEVRAAVRSAAVFAAVVVVTAAPFVALGGFPSTMVRFHLERPVQVESTAATVLEIAGGTHVTGDPILHDRFKSNGLDGGPASAVADVSTLALLVAGLWIVVLAARRPTTDGLVIAALAVTLAFVCFSKVLSPQYMCWLLPLAAVAWWRGAAVGAALTWIAATATQAWFPRNYEDVYEQHAWAVVAVGIRNLILLLALAATARALARSPRPVAAAPRSG